MTLERAEAWHLTDPFTGGQWLVQFWDTHTEDRHGKRRLAVAVFQNSPTFPSTYKLVLKSRCYYAPLSLSCDGPESAKLVLDFLQLDDLDSSELEVTSADDIGEHYLTY